MTLRSPRPLGIAAALIAAALAAGAYVFFRSVDAERDRAREDGRVLVTAEELAAPDLRGVALWLPREAPRDTEPFAGRVYVATSAGLAVFEADGRFVRRYTTLDGLPENALTCLERYDGRLYIGTETSGLLAFDGDRFTRFRFERPRAAKVAALRAAGGELLIGTFEAGVFEYDGASFTRRYATALGVDCRRVTAILDAGPRLYVGTFDAGLFEWREGAVARYGTTEGLRSARVVGLAQRGGAVLVATDLGVAEIDNGAIRPFDETSGATAIAERDGEVFLATLNRGVVLAGSGPMTPASDRPHARPGARSAALPAGAATAVKVEDGVLWALSDAGVFASVGTQAPARFEPFGDEEDGPRLAAGHVAAIAADGRGRLLVGYFDGGVDVVDPATGQVVDRMDDPALREVNAIVPDYEAGRTWIASSKGIAAVDGGRRTRLLGVRDGLAGENAAAVCALSSSGGLAVATNKGVTVFDGTVGRSITAFHGLPNNHVYAVAETGGKLYAGTLGGLAEIDGLRVTRVLSAANSALPHNWVNGLASYAGRLYVGTYGGGVAELLPTGDLVLHEETAGLEVNPGAMLVDSGSLYVGTLGAGVFVLDIESGRWRRVTAGLASRNVTAIAADTHFVYFGTEHGITRVERSTLF